MREQRGSIFHLAGRFLAQVLGEKVFVFLCAMSILLAIFGLVVLLYDVFRDGSSAWSERFLTSPPSRFPEKAGILPALVGTLWLMFLTTLFTVPLAIGAAVYLEEFAPKNRITRFLQVNIANLAGVPSIVYGLLGLAVFVRSLQLGRSVLAGALTMSLLILPFVIASAQEALRAVPRTYREASLALGATPWETVRYHVLPLAMPGILTGIILGLSRAIGEAAPLITIGALTFITKVPQSPMDPFTVLPIQIFNWVSMPKKEFHALAAAGIMLLLAVLLLFTGVAVYIRERSRRSP
ncbi:MAG: phosphate ABC transporter permease PstA [Fimbriimonadales bacterium]|nr:phosphate ABC transporter permease PstA [Fimbriimonadales bacterium]